MFYTSLIRTLKTYEDVYLLKVLLLELRLNAWLISSYLTRRKPGLYPKEKDMDIGIEGVDVFYKSKKISKIIEGSDESFDCYLIAYAGPKCAGFGIIYKDKNKNPILLDQPGPPDLVALWRCTQILLKMKVIRRYFLLYVYEVAHRIVPRYRRGHAKLIIEYIGQETYDNIMAEPLPEKIVKTILTVDGVNLDAQFQHENVNLSTKTRFYPLILEAEVGTVHYGVVPLYWCVPDPLSENEMRGKYGDLELLVKSYCRHCTRPERRGWQFDDKEIMSAIIWLLDHGVRNTQSGLVAIAGAMIGVDLPYCGFRKNSNPSKEECVRIENISFNQSLNWLSQQFPIYGNSPSERGLRNIFDILFPYFPREK